MSTTEIRQALPTGTWQLDPVHSSIGFEIEYMVGAFRGQFRDVEATLSVDGDDARLTGAARVASVDVKDENLAAHLQSPEFFDVERYPELRFVSTDITGDEELTVRGEITIKGVTQPVELTGRATEPLTDAYGRERIGLTLSTTLDRTAFGLNWNLPLPSGEPALASEVTLVAELYFVREA
ncbi:MAG TPA: YceI family protein [Gaiellaceae bacterium]|jgi:polyisoprenoid-binding protein YceI|nr:YceI family protein [Gaiellaceae bacterium]